jgi:hypothetical protein
MNKRAIELSINFLVVVIISMVILSTGILLIKRYFGVAEEIKTQLDEQTIAHIEELLDQGDIVAMPLKRKTIESGNSDIFGLGVININEANTFFNVNIALSKLVKEDKTTLNPADLNYNPEDWLLYEKSFNLEFKENKKIAIRLAVPDGVYQGTYIYDVEVLANNNRYGFTKMYVVVP